MIVDIVELRSISSAQWRRRVDIVWKGRDEDKGQPRWPPCKHLAVEDGRTGVPAIRR